jgi:hypothetical protein
MQSIRFVRQNLATLLAISAAVLIPCFWQRTIVAGDLGSHMYNAWLAQLIEHGQAPGLWLAQRWNNVLFDLLLDGLGRLFPWNVTEKIAVSLAVLIFFWGTVALVSAAARRVPWFVLPCIAMFAYGYSFHMGFFNFYISIGLSFFGIAIFWRGEGWERLIPVVLAPLIMLAHPLGFAWLVAGSAYGTIAAAISRRFHILLLAASVALVYAAHYYFWHHDVVQAQDNPLYFFNGSDQLVLFGSRYAIIAYALLILTVAALLADVLSRGWRQGRWKDSAIPFQLYLIAYLAVILLPDGIRFGTQTTALALITERITSISAAILCCLLGATLPRRWHLVAFSAIAVVFFIFLYQDTAIVNLMETQVEQLVRTLPPGRRVLATIKPFPGSRVLIQHMLDRACIGYCYSYGNYEPGSTWFRVRSSPGNQFVMNDFDSAADTEDGSYEVQPEDLPAYQVYQCSSTGKQLCIRALEAGEMNDRLGVHQHE